MRVLQSWDDGIVDDIRLAEIFRRHGAKAAFNLNPGLHGAARGHGWSYGEKQVFRLARSELGNTYDGFEIANHTMTHPDLRHLSSDQYAHEIMDARKMLQDWFGQTVDGFCYPYGRAIPEAQRVIEEAGHFFACSAQELTGVTTTATFRLIDPHCHFADPEFWSKYEEAAKQDSYFFFWGHSYELMTVKMWNDFEGMIAKVSNDPRVVWMTPGEYISSCRAA